MNHVIGDTLSEIILGRGGSLTVLVHMTDIVGGHLLTAESLTEEGPHEDHAHAQEKGGAPVHVLATGGSHVLSDPETGSLTPTRRGQLAI